MKKLLVLLLTVFALNSCEQDPEIIGVDAEKKQLKVDVCHYDADTDTWKTINISKNALKAHLKHGDYEGECEKLIDICHYDKETNTRETISIREDELEEHLEHGDYEGECREGYTYVPDEALEQHLINLGYDEGSLDDFVLTRNINTIEILHLPLEVECLTYPDCDFLYYSFQNLIGIEDFIGLKELSGWCPNINVPIDLTALINLESISFYQSTMPSFDLPKNLKYFWIEDGEIETLDISNNLKLEALSLSGCFRLTCIQKGDNPLTNLTYTGSIPIEIDCDY